MSTDPNNGPQKHNEIPINTTPLRKSGSDNPSRQNVPTHTQSSRKRKLSDESSDQPDPKRPKQDLDPSAISDPPETEYNPIIDKDIEWEPKLGIETIGGSYIPQGSEANSGDIHMDSERTPHFTFAPELEKMGDVAKHLKIPLSPEATESVADLLDSLRSLIETVLSKLPKTQAEPTEVWGKLFPQSGSHQPINLSGNIFTIGRNIRCNLHIKDSALNSILCKIYYVKGRTFIEGVATSGVLTLNKRPIRGNVKFPLKSGDEVTIKGNLTFSYIYQQITKQTVESESNTSRVGPPQLSIPEIITTEPADKHPASESELDEVVEKESEALAKIIEKIEKMITTPENISVTFDSFPYYLSPSLKQLLINSVYVFLEKPEFSKYVNSIPNMSRRVMLSGPKGTTIYQETLVRGLAKHFNAKLLILDDCFPEQFSESDTLLTGLNSFSSGSSKYTSLSTLLDDLSSGVNPNFDANIKTFKKGDKVKYIGGGSLFGGSSLLRHLHPREDKKSLTVLSGGSRKGPSIGHTGTVMITFDDNPSKVGVKFDKPIPGGINLGNTCEEKHGFFVEANELKLEQDNVNTTEESSENLIMKALFEILYKPENHPCIVFIKNFEKSILSSYDRYTNFKKEAEKLESRVVFFASSTFTANKKDKNDRTSLLVSPKGAAATHTALLDISFLDHLTRFEERKETNKGNKLVTKTFPTTIAIYSPQDKEKLAEWQEMIKRDRELLKNEANRNILLQILNKNNISCDKLDQISLNKKVFTRNQVEKIVGWAVSHHLMSTTEGINLIDEKLSLSPDSIKTGFSILDQTSRPKSKSILEIETDNEFEKRLLPDVIQPNELNLSFESIGALDRVKETLKELVMLPLQRPELFRKGNLTKPCKGILLFGPPGTGKTMLAKAVATESGANFLSISMASIGSKWFGEGEKYTRAVFTLASKISPCVIFIDEVDCILGKRENHGEHEAMRKIKNEFMMMWDGLKTRQNERVLVLAATNRPFDLDDAVLRRLPRRLLVDLPDTENRVKVLKIILKDEELDPSVDFKDIAKITEGFSGSDLHNLCYAAAYQPIREFLKSEKAVNKEIKIEDPMLECKEGKPTPPLRPLTMEDFINAKKDISASVSEDAQSIAELRKWNDLYGEGGSRKKTTLSYFV